MERLNLQRIVRASTLLSLPIAASLSSCRNESENPPETSPTHVSQTSPTPEISSKQDIIEAAKLKGLGTVFVSIVGNTSQSIELQLNRTDKAADPNDAMNEQIVTVGSNQTAVLGTSSCEGEYSLLFSIDGGATFKPVLQGTTPDRPLSDTFELDDNCSKDLNLLFRKAGTSTQ